VRSSLAIALFLRIAATSQHTKRLEWTRLVALPRSASLKPEPCFSPNVFPNLIAGTSRLFRGIAGL
jgi:hypothetical protein